MRLHTPNGGTLTLTDCHPCSPKACVSCAERSSNLKLRVVYRDAGTLPHEPSELDIALCPKCVAEAFAVQLGRKHIDKVGLAGLTDLTPRSPAVA